MNIISKLFMVQRFDRNKVKCDSCRAVFPFTELEPLQLNPCPKCKCPVFIPAKIGKYWLFCPLGAGGFGAVYKGIHASNFKITAVKTLKGDYAGADKDISMLRQEYEVGVCLRGNPGLVEPLELGKQDNYYYLVYEFVDGVRMDMILRELRQIPESIAYKLIMQILEIEQYIYDHGYLYRDLKPENIMIDNRGRLKLLDYGLCLTLEEAEVSNMKRDTIVGSPHFLPPERIAGQAENQHSEIYSMGMLFYNMLAGHTFYKTSKSAKDLIVKHLKSARLKSVRPSLSSCNTITGLIINRMIHKSPDERFSNYEVLRKALNNAYKQIKRKNRHREEMTFREFINSYKS